MQSKLGLEKRLVYRPSCTTIMVWLRNSRNSTLHSYQIAYSSDHY